MSEEMNLVDSHEFKEGDLVKATIAQVDEKSAIVTIEGAPFDGIVPISELSSLHIEKASDAVSIGEELECYDYSFYMVLLNRLVYYLF